MVFKGIFSTLAVLIAASFLSSTPADARRRHHHGHHHRHKHVEKHIDRGNNRHIDCSVVSRPDPLVVELDFSPKQAVTYTDVSWQDIYASANAPFDSIPAMVELPTVAVKPDKHLPTSREKLGVILFGGIMLFGSVFSMLPRRKRSFLSTEGG